MQARVRPDQESLTSLITQNFRQLCQDHLLYTQDIAIRGSLLFTIDSYDTYDIDVNEKVPLKRSGRGRQKKFPQQLSEIDESIIRDEVISRVTASSNDSPGSIPRKRGRPPKSASAMEVKPSTEENHSDDLVSRLSEVNDLNTPTTRKRRNCKSIYRTPDIPLSESATHSKESLDDNFHDTGSQMTSQNETKSPKSRSKVLPKKSKSPSAKIIDSEGETSINETVNQTLEVSEEGKHATGTGTSSSASDVNKSSVLEDGTGVEESMPQETCHDEAGKAGNEPDAENSDQPDAGPVTEAGEEGSIKVEKQEVEDVDPSLNDSQMKTDGQENVDQVLQPAQKKRRRGKSSLNDLSSTLCDLCGLDFEKASALKYHMAVKHRMNFDYNCEECGRGFRNKMSYTDHMAMHSGTRNHICQYCGIEYRYKSGLSRHFDLKHNKKLMSETEGKQGIKKVPCTICNKVMQCKDTLADHMRAVHPRPGIDLRYKCVCGRSYPYRASLSQHKKVCRQIHGDSVLSKRRPSKRYAATPEKIEILDWSNVPGEGLQSTGVPYVYTIVPSSANIKNEEVKLPTQTLQSAHTGLQRHVTSSMDVPIRREGQEVTNIPTTKYLVVKPDHSGQTADQNDSTILPSSGGEEKVQAEDQVIVIINTDNSLASDSSKQASTESVSPDDALPSQITFEEESVPEKSEINELVPSAGDSANDVAMEAETQVEGSDVQASGQTAFIVQMPDGTEGILYADDISKDMISSDGTLQLPEGTNISYEVMKSSEES